MSVASASTPYPSTMGSGKLVQARVCKDDLKDNAKPSLTASKVIGHPAKAENGEEDD